MIIHPQPCGECCALTFCHTSRLIKKVLVIYVTGQGEMKKKTGKHPSNCGSDGYLVWLETPSPSGQKGQHIPTCFLHPSWIHTHTHTHSEGMESCHELHTHICHQVSLFHCQSNQPTDKSALAKGLHRCFFSCLTFTF